MRISIVAAMDKNWIIGKDGKLPWRIPEDLKRFRRITITHPIVMGRATAESLKKPLSQRVNIVLTSGGNDLPKEFYKVDSLREAIKMARNAGAEEVFFIGGAFVFRQAISIVDKMYLTFINHAFEGDTTFPVINWEEWNFTESIHVPKSENAPYEMYFATLERKLPINYADKKPPEED